jgi:hypothetical protein
VILSGPLWSPGMEWAGVPLLFPGFLGERKKAIQNPELGEQEAASGSHLVYPLSLLQMLLCPSLVAPKGPALRRLRLRLRLEEIPPTWGGVRGFWNPPRRWWPPLPPWPLSPPSSQFHSVSPTGGFGTAEQFNSYYSIKINNIKMS